MAFGTEIPLLKESAAERFPVGEGLTLYDSHTSQRIAETAARGWYQRDIAQGRVTAGYAGGSYARSLDSYVDRLRSNGLDVASVVLRGVVYLLVGERVNLQVAALSAGVIPCHPDRARAAAE